MPVATSARSPLTSPSTAGRLSLPVRSTSRSRKWALDIPFEWRAWASQQRVRWDSEHKVSVFEGPDLPEHLKPFAAKPFSWEWVNEQTLNGTWDAPAPSSERWVPRPHQAQAALAIHQAIQAGWPGFLLADDVGLGKTISAWAFALASPAIQRVLIVSTVSVLAHWRNTLLHVGHGNKRTLIINYDRLGKLFELPGTQLSSSRKKGKQKRLAREAPAPAFDLIIWDESHKCKNPSAARSQMAIKLNAKAGCVLWLSATAGQTPLELSYLAPLLAQATGSRASSLKDFEEWCKTMGLGVTRGAYGKWAWERSDQDVSRMHGWLFGGKVPPGLRRRPEEIAGWRELERQLRPMDLDPAALVAYEQAWETFRQEEMGSPARLRKGAKPDANALVRRLRLRQKSSWLRIPSTVATIEEFLDNGQQVAVSVAFRDTQEEIARLLRERGLAPALIHGEQSAGEKEDERLRFQRGDTPVVLFTVEEGISLHQGEHNDVPRVLLVHDLRWSAIQMAQIEGRCHRDGRFAPSLWLFASDTVDERIAHVLVGRVKTMKGMLGDDTATLDAIEAVLKDLIGDEVATA